MRHSLSKQYQSASANLFRAPRALPVPACPCQIRGDELLHFFHIIEFMIFSLWLFLDAYTQTHGMTSAHSPHVTKTQKAMHARGPLLPA